MPQAQGLLNAEAGPDCEMWRTQQCRNPPATQLGLLMGSVTDRGDDDGVGVDSESLQAQLLDGARSNSVILDVGQRVSPSIYYPRVTSLGVRGPKGLLFIRHRAGTARQWP